MIQNHISRLNSTSSEKKLVCAKLGHPGVASNNVSLKKCVGIQNMTGGAVRFCIPC